ncbi:MAG: DUF1801 domain-containing protein [Clostridiales bacterium]|jgi:hypothetical protein|nr:DUF1801 domain-containing protein [Clostridiales bacterium]
MAEPKTKPHDGDVFEFIDSFADSEQKKQDSYTLVGFFREVTGFEPKMWGNSMIGFGSYHYKSQRSRQEGDWPLVGFSPRKAAITLYVLSGLPQQEDMLKNLGKFTSGKGCLYVKKLSDINPEILKSIVLSTVGYLQEQYGKQ